MHNKLVDRAIAFVTILKAVWLECGESSKDELKGYHLLSLICCNVLSSLHDDDYIMKLTKSFNKRAAA